MNPALSEADCLKAIGQLSAGFTVSRDKLGKYGDEVDLVSAYTLVYLPTNIPKLEFVLSQLRSDVFEQLQDAHFIDFGCGPGTFSLAWANQLRTAAITLVDYTKGMRDQAQKILSHFHPNIPLSVTDRLIERPKGKVVLFFGHAINELPEGEFEHLIERLEPDFIFYIEPGTSEFFTRAKKLRDYLITKGMSIAYPCPTLAACPNDWCHQVWRGTHDPEVERLCQLAKLDRRTQPMTAHLYSKNKIIDERAMFTRFLNETKFSFEWEACLAEGELLQLEWQKKSLSKVQVKEFSKTSVGRRFLFEIVKKLDSKKLRVSPKDSEV